MAKVRVKLPKNIHQLEGTIWTHDEEEEFLIFCQTDKHVFQFISTSGNRFDGIKYDSLESLKGCKYNLTKMTLQMLFSKTSMVLYGS